MLYVTLLVFHREVERHGIDRLMQSAVATCSILAHDDRMRRLLTMLAIQEALAFFGL